MERTIAHLGFLQAVISRMGSNSFLLKGWSVTLVSAIFMLSAKDADYRFILMAYFPILIFWVLDAFFLHQEKLYRKLYEEVAAGNISSDCLSMDTSVVKHTVKSMVEVAFSKTLLPFHGLIVAIVLFAMFVIMAPHA